MILIEQELDSTTYEVNKASQSYWNARSMIIEIIWKQKKKEKHCNLLQQAFRHLPKIISCLKFNVFYKRLTYVYSK